MITTTSAIQKPSVANIKVMYAYWLITEVKIIKYSCIKNLKPSGILLIFLDWTSLLCHVSLFGNKTNAKAFVRQIFDDR